VGEFCREKNFLWPGAAPNLSCRKAALAAYDQFIASYQAKFPKATECLGKDKECLFTFYDFPAQHWSHLRTTNPIESTFATVRLRTQRTKGCGSRIATLSMVCKAPIEWFRTHPQSGYRCAIYRWRGVTSRLITFGKCKSTFPVEK